MFNFIKSRLGGVKAVTENQRQTIERALGEVNEIVALMDAKPRIVIDPATGAVVLELPDQMPDEALALPAPDPTPETDEAAKEAA